MNTLALLACAGSMAVAAMAQDRIQDRAPEKLLRTSTSFSLIVPASYEKTAPLFGPEGERAWAGKHWDPQFIYPQPAHDEPGAVFTISHRQGALKAVWVTTQFDANARHFQYVYFMPDLMVTMIDVRFKVVSPDRTGVNVVYTRTALTAEGNEHVTAMTDGDQTAGKEWQAAIDEYLSPSHAKQQ
jgi:hypothetical protein